MSTICPRTLFTDWLPKEQYPTFSLVCKEWKGIIRDIQLESSVTDLRAHFPRLTVFDKTAWNTHVDSEKHQLSFNDTPPIKFRDVAAKLSELFDNKVKFKKTLFKRVPKHNPGLKDDGGATLLLLPRGLSLIKIGEIGQKIFARFHLNLLEIDIDEEEHLPHSRWVLVTDPIDHTDKIPMKASLQLLKNMGYTVPTLLPLLVLEILKRKVHPRSESIPCKVTQQLIKFTANGWEAEKVRAFYAGAIPRGKLVFATMLIPKRNGSIPVCGAWYP